MIDDRGRALERAWQAGDPQAGAALAQHLVRTQSLTLEWIAALGPLAHAAIADLPDQLLEAASYALVRTPGGAAGAAARFLCGFDGNWFPDHRRVDVCPRGHPFEFRGNHGNFVMEEVSTGYRATSGLRAPGLPPPDQVLLVESATQQYDAGPMPAAGWAFFMCEQRVSRTGSRVICSASWHVPSDQVEYE